MLGHHVNRCARLSGRVASPHSPSTLGLRMGAGPASTLPTSGRYVLIRFAAHLAHRLNAGHELNLGALYRQLIDLLAGGCILRKRFLPRSPRCASPRPGRRCRARCHQLFRTGCGPPAVLGAGGKDAQGASSALATVPEGNSIRLVHLAAREIALASSERSSCEECAWHQ